MAVDMMAPIVACAIKFGPYIESGPLKGGHAGIFTQISIDADPDKLEALRVARLSGLLYQGFLQEGGRFCDRPSARIIAIHNGQVREEDLHSKSIIYSEDFVREEPKS